MVMSMDIYEYILKEIHSIEERMQIMPQDMLGRTLAYNTFLPRLSDRSYFFENLNKSKGLLVDTKSFASLIKDSKILDNSDMDISCVFLENLHNDDVDNIADYIGMIRRFMPVFVGYSGIIISTYQLLELAIFGADMFVIDMSHIKCYVEILGVDNKTEMIDSISNKLIAFGINIGLVPILYLNDDSRHIFLQNSDVLESVLIYNENYDIDNKIIFGNTHKANVALERIIT